MLIKFFRLLGGGRAGKDQRHERKKQHYTIRGSSICCLSAKDAGLDAARRQSMLATVVPFSGAIPLKEGGGWPAWGEIGGLPGRERIRVRVYIYIYIV